MLSLERKNLPKLVNQNGARPAAKTVTKADAPQILNHSGRRSLGLTMFRLFQSNYFRERLQE